MTKIASPILSLLLARGVGPKTISDILDATFSRDLFSGDLSLDEAIADYPLRAELKENIITAQAAASSLAEHLDREDIQVLIRGIEPYPRKLTAVLGKLAPAVLFARGNLSLFDSKAVGFCGSRKASDKGIRVASDTATDLAKRKIDVVSGYAKGVDLAVHSASLLAGGTTTIVLAEGILHFKPKREIKKLLDSANHLVVSEFSPRLPWSVQNAMRRNTTIIGLSNAMIVIESGMTGGTHACAETALGLKHPLFVADYATPSESAEGNRYFIEQGANALRGDSSGHPSLARLFKAIGL